MNKFLTALLFVCTLQVQAFEVKPMLADIKSHGAEKSTSIEVGNDSADIKRFEVSAKRWKQDAEKDVFEETTDILYFPRTFELQPGAKQTVKAVYKAKPGLAEDQAYRLFIKESAMQDFKESDKLQASIKMLYNVAVGIFVAADSPKHEDLTFRVLQDNGKAVLRITNAGNTRLASGEATFKFGEQSIAGPGVWHVLPGSTRSFPLKAACSEFQAGKLSLLNPDKTRIYDYTVDCH